MRLFAIFYIFWINRKNYNPFFGDKMRIYNTVHFNLS